MDFEETKSYRCKVNLKPRSIKPVVGCEINPVVSIRAEGHFATSSYSLNFKWYKEQSEPKVCSTHRDKLATLQCISCVKLKIPAKDSYYCSTKCFINSWKTHLQRHHYKTEKIKETSTDDKQTVRKIRSCGSWPEFSSEFLIGERAVAEEGNKWILVGCSKNYVPKIDDLGLNLKLECVAVDILTDTALSEMSVIVTDHVMEFPLAKPRRMVQIRHQHEYSNLCSSSFNGITFSILSYNILSDLYTVRRYRHCPQWALAWEYRRQNLLREIIDYDADIICLQEMQSDHFESFLKPELTKKGYLAIYKKRTNEVYTANQYVTDGCATFYQCDLFKEVMKYEIEFNKKTSPVVEALKPELRNEASIRLKKDNVALVVILETLESCHTYDAFRSSVCVVNTHICSSPELPDVKLFQVVTLISELEKILPSEIPLLICGDFNSVPQSDPHTYIVTSKLEHTESVDPHGIYQHLKLDHRFSMGSAYAKLGLAIAAQERQLGRFNLETREPTFTYSARGFSGTLDYIFFTGLLELLDHKDVAAGLPSPLWSSDHIALMASFRIPTQKLTTALTHSCLQYLQNHEYW
ncbi:hypothetical protein L6164_030585 [Bauhinia variegata]|uniref:Uncharacterized protein n=1 Tax=Bauhinia variegata TaxID=167791 RepID=A0ACB9LDN8_BAUVA|nr:hypothetical protein L6164_030585 [Bauhinia variegata]